jgi:hypothetical protein
MAKCPKCGKYAEDDDYEGFYCCETYFFPDPFARKRERQAAFDDAIAKLWDLAKNQEWIDKFIDDNKEAIIEARDKFVKITRITDYLFSR